jgi:hypothetical protein
MILHSGNLCCGGLSSLASPRRQRGVWRQAKQSRVSQILKFARAPIVTLMRQLKFIIIYHPRDTTCAYDIDNVIHIHLAPDFCCWLVA